MRQFPIAEPRKIDQRGRKKRVSAILTESPVRNRLAEEFNKTGYQKTSKSKEKASPKKVKKNQPDSVTYCLVCGENFDEEWIQCLQCHEWAHWDCTDGTDYYTWHNCEDD